MCPTGRVSIENLNSAACGNYSCSHRQLLLKKRRDRRLPLLQPILTIIIMACVDRKLYDDNYIPTCLPPQPAGDGVFINHLPIPGVMTDNLPTGIIADPK